MAKNLFGEVIFNPSDIAKSLIEENTQVYDLIPMPGTKQGFVLSSKESDGYPFVTGFYTILLKDTVLYCGYSMSPKNGIYNRISRWVKEVKGSSTLKEKHPAAKKFRYMYGRNLTNLKVKLMPYHSSDKNTIKAIEKSLIAIQNPWLNKIR